MLEFLDDLPLIKAFLIYAAAFAFAFVVLQLAKGFMRWRRGEKPWTMSGRYEVLENALSMLWLCALLAVMDQKSWSAWVWFGSIAVLIGLASVVSIWVMKRKLAELQEDAAANPEQASAVPEPPPIDWEAEKRQALVLIPAMVIYIGGIFAVLWGAKAWGMETPGRAGLALLWMIGVPAVAALFRYPGRLSQYHTTVIAVSPQTVWDTLHCRETTTYYRKPCARIEKVPGTENRFVWHYSDLGFCCRCGLPKDQHHSTTHTFVEVVEQETGRSARQISTFPDGTPFWCQLYRYEDNRFEIAPHASGAEVTYEVSVVGPRLWMLALLATGNIPRDLLADLKAHLEGTKGEGVFANGRNHAAYAAASPKLCGCT